MKRRNLSKNKTQWKQQYKFMLASQHILVRCLSRKITSPINDAAALTTNIIYFSHPKLLK